MFSVGLTEIVLIVRDVHVAAHFYRHVVGLTPIREANDEWAWFEAGDATHLQRIALHKGALLFEEHSPFPAGARWGRVHYAFHVPSERLELAATHLREAGVAVYGPVELEWMRARSYYFYDPDGNLLEFLAPQSAP
jgi:lactoylglutathione lyase